MPLNLLATWKKNWHIHYKTSVLQNKIIRDEKIPEGISQNWIQNLLQYNPKDMLITCQCCSHVLWQGLVQGDSKCLPNPSCLNNLESFDLQLVKHLAGQQRRLPNLEELAGLLLHLGSQEFHQGRVTLLVPHNTGCCAGQAALGSLVSLALVLSLGSLISLGLLLSLISLDTLCSPGTLVTYILESKSGPCMFWCVIDMGLPFYKSCDKIIV